MFKETVISIPAGISIPMEFPLHGVLLSNEKEHIIDIHTGGGHGNPLQYACLENPHAQRSLAGYSPWGYKQSDMTDHAHSSNR